MPQLTPSPVTAQSVRLSPPRPDQWGRPLMMALAAHAALVVALSWGVRWQPESPVVFEAELWSRLPQPAAPRAPAPSPVAEPVLAPDPVPVQPPPPPPAPAPAPKPVPSPVPPPPRAPDVTTAKTPAQPDARALAQQQAQRDAAQRAERERDAQRREQARRDAARQAAAQQEAQREAERQRQIERMLSQANATGATASTGTADRASGPSASYAGQLVGAIKPNIVLTDLVAGNPRAEVELRAAPDGTIVSARLRQSSGSLAWDQAVLRAIERTGKLPLDDNGRVPSALILGFRPLD